MSTTQQTAALLTEAKIALQNYKIIIDKAKEVDTDLDSPFTYQLFYTIYHSHLPIIDVALKESAPVDAPRIQQLYELACTNFMSVYEEANGFFLRQSLFSNPLVPSSLGPKSPLLLLLKVGIEKGSIVFTRNQPQDRKKHDWSRLASIKRFIKNLGLKSNPMRATEGPKAVMYYPGTPACIMALVPVWNQHDVIVSTSADKYIHSEALFQLSKTCHHNTIQEFRNACSTTVQKRLERIEDMSKTIISYVSESGNSDHLHLKQLVSSDDYRQDLPIYLPGLLSTWGPSGGYMPACLLDFCRFRAHRPPAAEEVESQRSIKVRRAFGHDSCAEWVGFVECVSMYWAISADNW